MLDSVPLAGINDTLQAMSTATNGLCLSVDSERQCMALFEREALLHVPYREVKPPRSRIASARDLTALVKRSEVVSDVQLPAPKQLASAVAAPARVSAVIDEAQRTTGSGPLKRVTKELRACLERGRHVYVSEEDLMFWRVVLEGPAGTPYQGRFFLVTAHFPSDYPFKPPRVRFVTPIYHANISNDGGVCVDVLKDTWNPALTIDSVLIQFETLMREPNFADPLDAYKAQLGLTDLPK